ncbi:MAG TPA: tripartite tricarboxylate transporter substrate binding protein, partial [Geminicoccaceae bacterium]|nr:tripartite tricarboxylate transporter substrate binding protein [Geminicoccaceae bacterium]
QPVSVVNRTGGGGVLGHTAMANAAPDGYTLGIASMEITLYEAQGLAPLSAETFQPILRLAAIPGSVTVAADSEYQGVGDVLQAIRDSQPRAMKASGCGVGCAWHLALAGWLKREGLEPDHVQWVPSQGGAPALQDVVAKGLDLTTASAVESRALREAGMVRTLAVMHDERQEAFPDIPTLEEELGTDWSMGTWFAFVGPNGLPGDVMARLEEAARSVFEGEQFQAFMAERGYVPVGQGPEEAAAFMREFGDTLAPLIEELGIASR